MRAVTDMSRQELEQLMANEIANARAEARPISRLALIRLIQSKSPMNPHEAERLVDVYCDEKAPGVPTYLSNEFGVPYLKGLAIFNLVVGFALAIMTAVIMSRGGYGFLIWLGLSVLFFGGAAIAFYQSVRPDKNKTSGVVMTTQLPNIGGSQEIAEPISTGSSQQRN